MFSLKQNYVILFALILAIAAILLAILSFKINNVIDFKLASIILASINGSFLLNISKRNNKFRYLLILNLIFIISMCILSFWK